MYSLKFAPQALEDLSRLKKSEPAAFKKAGKLLLMFFPHMDIMMISNVTHSSEWVFVCDAFTPVFVSACKLAAISGSVKWPGDTVSMGLVCKRLLLWRQIFPSVYELMGEKM